MPAVALAKSIYAAGSIEYNGGVDLREEIVPRKKLQLLVFQRLAATEMSQLIVNPKKSPGTR